MNAADASKLGITLVGEGDISATPTPRKLTIEIKGPGNRVVLDEDHIDGRFTINGSDNVIRCDGHPATRFPVKLFVSIVGNGCEVHLGEGLTTNGLSIIMHGEGPRITIGRDAMFSFGIFIRNCDSHAMVDLKTREVLNGTHDIEIGEHVWIGQDAMLLNEVRIGRGTVVAARSVVTGEVPACSVVAGVPARVVREDVSWTRQLAPTANQIDAMMRMLEKK